jgi:D-erythro-7,8-dihydroneopterin triphosphate epimerase
MTKKLTTIRITDLQLRTIIGANDWERDHKQDIVINVELAYDAADAIAADDLKNSVDYKIITKKIIKDVEASQFFLIEKLADMVLGIVMQDKRVKKSSVRIDKPFALRFARTVSVEVTAEQ